MKLKPQYWVINTDEGKGVLEARPFKNIREAEKHIAETTKELWEGACSCLQSDKSVPWCKPYLIVQTVRTVQPEITANIKLVPIK